jgi:hypothetical protein
MARFRPDCARVEPRWHFIRLSGYLVVNGAHNSNLRKNDGRSVGGDRRSGDRVSAGWSASVAVFHERPVAPQSITFFANRVRHIGAPRPHGSGGASRRVACGLMLHFGIKLSAH